MLRILRRSEFSRHAGVLLSGNVAAQLLPLLVLPVITRVYAPSELGAFAVYLAIATTIGAVACAKLELAIIVAPDDGESLEVAGTALAITVLMATGTLGVLWVGRDLIETMFRIHLSYTLALLLAVIVGATGLIQILMSVLNRGKRYRAMATSRVIQVASTAALQVVLGLTVAEEYRTVALLVATVVGQLAALPVLLLRTSLSLRGESGFGRIVEVAFNVVRRYRTFVLYNTPYSFLAAFSRSIPIYIFATFGTATHVGHFSLARSAAYAPQGVLSFSLGPVYFERAARLRGKVELEVLTNEIMFAVAIVFAPVFAYVGYWGVEIFEIAFGPRWSEAGEYFTILSIPALLVLFASWQHRLYEVTRRQRLALTLQVMSDIVIAAGLWTALHSGASVRGGMSVLAILLSAYYLVWTAVTYRIAGFALKRLVPVLIVSVLSGGAVLAGCGAAHALLKNPVPALAASLSVVFACYVIAYKLHSKKLITLAHGDVTH